MTHKDSKVRFRFESYSNENTLYLVHFRPIITIYVIYFEKINGPKKHMLSNKAMSVTKVVYLV